MRKLLSLLTAVLLVGSVWADVTLNSFGSSTSGTAYVETEGSLTDNSSNTWKVKGYRVTNNGSTLIIGKGGANYLETPEFSDDISSIQVTWSGNADYYLALQTKSGTELEAKSNPSTSSTETFTVTGSYKQLRLVGRRSSGTSNAAANITQVVVTFSTGVTLSSIAISGDLTKKTYDDEETLDYSGLTVTGTYSDDSHADLTSSAEWSYAPALSVGLTSVTVTATVGGKSADKAITGLTVTKHVVVADEYGFDLNATFFGTTAGSNIPSTASRKENDVTFEIGTTSGTKPRTDADIVRFYKNNYLNISVPDGFEITDVKFTISQETWVIPFPTVDVMQNETTWKGFANSVTFVFAGTSFVDSVYVTYATADSDAGRISINPNYVSSKPEGGDGSIAIAYTNISDMLQVDDNFVLYDDINKTEHAGEEWVLAEWKNDKTTINYVVGANLGNTDRKVYLYIYAMDDQGDDVEKFIIFTQPKCDFATLPFAFSGGRDDIGSTVGLTYTGLGKDYGDDEKLKFDDQNDNLILKINEKPGTLSFKIKGNGFSGGTFKVQTSVNGTNYTDKESYTDGTIDGVKTINTIGEDVRYIKWVYSTKSNGNVGLGNISLAKPVPSALEDVETSVKAVKVLRNGVLYIEKAGKTYNAQGQLVK